MMLEKTCAAICLMVVAGMEADGRAAGKYCAEVHLQGAALVNPSVLQDAETTATRIFGDIGVSIHWTHSGSHFASAPAVETCQTIHLKFDTNTPALLRPDTMAYALPYQNGGTQIQVLLDRVVHPIDPHSGLLLGYVMTHEIGHVLQQISRHSTDGVMKACWTDADFHLMFRHALGFSDQDADLIRGGLSNRREIALLGNR